MSNESNSTMKIKLLLMISAFLLSMSASAQYDDTYSEKVPDYQEFITKEAEVYDVERAKEYAATKRDLLKEIVSFYDKQLSYVNKWIDNGRFKLTSKTEEKLEMSIFRSSTLLNKYEKNLSDDVRIFLENIAGSVASASKSGKKYMPVIIAFRDRLLSEKDSIEAIIEEESDSLLLTRKVTFETYIGLWYICYSRYSEADESIYQLRESIYRLRELNSSPLTCPMKWEEIKIKNPNYNPAEAKWAWIHENIFESVETTYPKKESYYRYASHPEYKVKRYNDRRVAYRNDSVQYIEGPSEYDLKKELAKQAIIYDYRHNKYDIQSTSASLQEKIHELLIEGKDQMYYAALRPLYERMLKAYTTMLGSTVDEAVKNAEAITGKKVSAAELEKFKAEAKAKLAQLEKEVQKAKSIDFSSPEYTTARNYIKQLKADRDDIKFTGRRIDDFSILYTSTDGSIKIKLTMRMNGKKIVDSYEAVSE